MLKLHLQSAGSFVQALLGRPLRISYAIDKVRGGPVVVPRLSSEGEATS